jgi:hypothetical protein
MGSQAKPSLEARKEKILERSRAQRELVRQLNTIIFIGTFIDSDISSLDPEKQRLARIKLEESNAIVLKAVKDMNELFPALAASFDRRVSSAVSFTAGRLTAIAQEVGSERKVGKELARTARLILRLLELYRWNFRKRRKLLVIANPRPSSSDA